MLVSDTLAPDRVLLVESERIPTKDAALAALANMLAASSGVQAELLEEKLKARERVQSTAIGHGIAIPHTSFATLDRQLAALIIARDGIPFEAIDGEPARIIMGVIGPTAGPSAHLRLLARVSRLFNNPDTRSALLRSTAQSEALALIAAAESS